MTKVWSVRCLKSGAWCAPNYIFFSSPPVTVPHLQRALRRRPPGHASKYASQHARAGGSRRLISGHTTSKGPPLDVCAQLCPTCALGLVAATRTRERRALGPLSALCARPRISSHEAPGWGCLKLITNLLKSFVSSAEYLFAIFRKGL